MKLFILLLSAITSFSVAQTVDNGTWTYDVNSDGTSITLTGCTIYWGTCPNDLVIPETIDDYTVTKIGDRAFLPSGSKGSFASVSIPSSVTSIGVYAFYNHMITNLVIPDSVLTIGEGAFESNELIELALGNGVNIISNAVFLSNRLTRITIPASVTEILGYAFGENPLESVEFLGDRPSLHTASFAILDSTWFTGNVNQSSVTYCQTREGWPGETIAVHSFSIRNWGYVTPVSDNIACRDSDTDGDGVADNDDIFPNDPSEWSDNDSDGIGDNSDSDDDNDGVPDIDDAFPLDASESLDTDGDGIGNNADPDDDNDGVLDVDDALPLDATESLDTDGDGIGNNSDPDDDNDGVLDSDDDLPLDSTESVDTDGDGIGNNADPDDDNDGVIDSQDAFPLDASESLDTDGDGIGNNADPDDDNDGVLDSEDDLPLDENETVDTDGDGIGNNTDPDDDNDGVLDFQDAFPLDASESLDTDGDGIGNNADTDDDGDGVLDSEDDLPLNGNETLDSDGDGVGNNADPDDDNDGILDSQDAFPLNSSEFLDTDGDGIGNNADPDDDNDGVLDNDDDLPLDSTESVDTDGDGIGNNADPDDDNDGVIDSQDAFPLKNTETRDSDGDGVGDNDEQRADLVAAEVLSQRMIHYLGYLASVFMEDNEEVAGQSGDWTLAIGSSVNNSFACVNGGGYNTVTTRTGFTSLRVTLTFLNCNYDGFSVNNSATFTWEDSYFDQTSPRQLFPMVFSFNNLIVTDSSSSIFRYFGSLSCDVAYNSVTESWTEKTEGDTIIFEGQWGSLYDSSVSWNNNSLVTNDAGNTDIYVVNGVNNCDFDSVLVTNNGQTHTITNAKYIAQPYGRGYNISEYTRQERLQKAITKEVFIREIYTSETGWVAEKLRPFEYNSVIQLSGIGEFGLNVTSDVVPTYFWASRSNVGDIVYQEIDQFSELEWVYLDIASGEITANNYRYEPGNRLDHENDGESDNVNAPWVSSRFHSTSDSECNWILRYQDWVVVMQGPDEQVYCSLGDGFYVYNEQVEYQDRNLDGRNELFYYDDDNDTVIDRVDNCQFIPNPDQLDTDEDSLGNACDLDDDGDSVPDILDAFPLDPSESIDTDGDGVGNNSDWAPYNSGEWADSDGDGVGNNSDAFPNDATETSDMDGDGIGDNSDSDIDGDGVFNSNDPFPLDGEYSADTDNDGMPDSWELIYDLDPNDASDALGDLDGDGISNLQEFLNGTPPLGSIDIDGNERYDALTDGLLILRSMFGLDGTSLTAGTAASDAVYSDSDELIARINTLGDLADIDGSGEIDALTDGLLILRHLFGLEGETLVAGVVSDDATRTTEEIEAHLNMLMP